MDYRRRYERMAFFQITLPILLAAIGAVGLFIAVAVSADGTGALGQLAAVLLSWILLFAGLIAIVFCLRVADVAGALTDFLPRRIGRLRRATRLMAAVTERICDIVIAPVLLLSRLRAMGAGFSDGVRDQFQERMTRHG
jgi:hypothetical protein